MVDWGNKKKKRPFCNKHINYGWNIIKINLNISDSLQEGMEILGCYKQGNTEKTKWKRTVI